jgi:serine/threonine protein kinase
VSDKDDLDWDLESEVDDAPKGAAVVAPERLDSIQDIIDSEEGADEDDEIFDERTWGDLIGESLVPGDVLDEKYRIDELIGYGAMGFVLRAWHIQLDEPVAIKLLLPELAASHEALVRFEREARAAFKIKSEHVARVLDVGRLGSGQPYMVMEYLEGIELGEKVYDQQMNIDELVDYMLQVCDAMAAAHGLDIVHRDVKPDNLFLTQRRDGSTCVKVLDFGLSKVVPRNSNAKRQKALTADAQVLGTAHYMSPEQWVASKDVGPAADIWALGVIMYEAVTGESPFMRNNLAAMCNAVLRHDPPAMHTFRDDVPKRLEKVVKRCMQKDAKDRYPTVTALATDLLPLVPTDTRPPPRFSTKPPIALRSKAKSEAPLAMRDTVPAPSSGGRGVPALGLVSPDGTVDSWADVLEAAPEPTKSSTPVYVAIAAAVIIAVVYALM